MANENQITFAVPDSVIREMVERVTRMSISKVADILTRSINADTIGNVAREVVRENVLSMGVPVPESARPSFISMCESDAIKAAAETRLIAVRNADAPDDVWDEEVRRPTNGDIFFSRIHGGKQVSFSACPLFRKSHNKNHPGSFPMKRIDEVMMTIWRFFNSDENKAVQKEPAATVKSAPLAERQPVPIPFDVNGVYKAVCKAIDSITSGESDPDDANGILEETLMDMTGGRVNAVIRKSTVGNKMVPSFKATEELRAIHAKKWNGIINVNNIVYELTRAFSYPADEERERDCSTPTSRRSFHTKRKGYKQGTYTKVYPGSRIMRMRCNKGGDFLSPMVIDPEFAKEMIDENFTHIKIMTGYRSGDLCFVFTKEQIPTRAPKKSKFIARLHPYGMNSSNGEVTTYSIGSHYFQETILEHYNVTCKGLEERIFGFEIARKDSEKCIIRLQYKQ